MMFVRTVNGYMYYPPGAGLTNPTSAGTTTLTASSAISSPTGATALQTIPNVSPTTVTPSPLNGTHNPTAGFAGYTPSAAPTAGTLNGLGTLTGYATSPTAGGLNGLSGISTGINGLGTTGLNGGLAAMSTTTALMGTVGAKWMLPGWNPFGLRFPLVRRCKSFLSIALFLYCKDQTSEILVEKCL